MKRASIFVDDVFCGVLVEDAEGYHFKYAEEYLAREEAKEEVLERRKLLLPLPT